MASEVYNFKEVNVHHYTDGYVFCRATDPVLSLDALIDGHFDQTGAAGFDMPDPSEGADERLHAIRASTAVTAFVASLGPRDKEMLRRIYWSGETQASVAECFGVSRMAISKAMAKVFQRGRRSLAPYRYFELND